MKRLILALGLLFAGLSAEGGQAQGINPITPPSNYMIRVLPPAFIDPSNLYTTPAILGGFASIVPGTTVVTAPCAANGVIDATGSPLTLNCIAAANNAVLVYNGSGVPSASVNLPSGLTASQFNVAEGSISSSVKSINITQTWNNSGVVFDAPLFMNVTTTAGANGSLLADFQVGGASAFSFQGLGGYVFGIRDGGAIRSLNSSSASSMFLDASNWTWRENVGFSFLMNLNNTGKLGIISHVIGTTTLATITTSAGELGFTKIAASGVAAGAAGGKIEVVCGTSGGSAKIIAYAGTSTTPVTVVDNIGSGVTGC